MCVFAWICGSGSQDRRLFSTVWFPENSRISLMSTKTILCHEILWFWSTPTGVNYRNLTKSPSGPITHCVQIYRQGCWLPDSWGKITKTIFEVVRLSRMNGKVIALEWASGLFFFNQTYDFQVAIEMVRRAKHNCWDGRDPHVHQNSKGDGYIRMSSNEKCIAPVEIWKRL